MLIAATILFVAAWVWTFIAIYRWRRDAIHGPLRDAINRYTLKDDWPGSG